MNTLTPAQRALIIGDRGRALALRRHWAALVRSPRAHALTAGHHLLYAALRGRDWRAGFTPISNPRKLANGGLYGWGLAQALWMLRSEAYAEQLLAPFDGLATHAMLAHIRLRLAHVTVYRLDAERVAACGLELPAYQALEGQDG